MCGSLLDREATWSCRRRFGGGGRPPRAGPAGPPGGGRLRGGPRRRARAPPPRRPPPPPRRAPRRGGGRLGGGALRGARAALGLLLALSCGGAHGVGEGPQLLGVLDAGSGLDAAGDVDCERMDLLDGRDDVVGRQAAAEDQWHLG